jgi:hypothetical protein
MSDPADDSTAMLGPEGPDPAQPAPVLGAAPDSVADYPATGAPPFINRCLSPAEFAAYVAGYAFGTLPPSRVVLHHTVVPTAAQWRGLPTMRGMQSYYAGLGWTSGPHLYAAPDGIWLATPMSRVGIHAGTGNGSVRQGWYSIGLEMVGNFDAAKPGGAVWAHAVAVMAALSARLGIPPRQMITFHRDYTDAKSCPGWAVTKDWVWDAVDSALAADAPASAHPILGGPDIPASDIVTILDRRAPHLSWQQRSSLTCAYTALGELTGIGNLRPLAQAVKETGWFTSRRFLENLNPAGLGATNDGADGAHFPSIAAGVAAQYAHLLCYAAKPGALPQTLLTLSELSPRRAALIGAYGLGSAPNWIDLNGKWASPGPTYGEDILTIAAALSSGGAS